MKQKQKITIMIICLIVFLIGIDTLQAKIWNRSPLLKIKVNKPYENVEYVEKGLLVNHYV